MSYFLLLVFHFICASIPGKGEHIMARPFARRFYHSAKWLTCREYVLKRDHYLCVHCSAPGEEVHHIIWLTPDNINDPNITLNPDNLQTVCRDCHHRLHERGKYTRRETTQDGLMFDENGNLIFTPGD